jgi:hypothetical protein
MVMKKVQYLILNYLSNTIQYRLLIRKYVAKVTKKDSKKKFSNSIDKIK